MSPCSPAASGAGSQGAGTRLSSGVEPHRAAGSRGWCSLWERRQAAAAPQLSLRSCEPDLQTLLDLRCFIQTREFPLNRRNIFSETEI